MLVIGKNSKVYSLIKDRIPAHISCSHQEGITKLIENHSIKKVLLLSYSPRLNENIQLVKLLYMSNVEVCYMSTSAAKYESCQKYSYPRSKRITEQVIYQYMDRFLILRCGLIESLHDLTKIHGRVPVTTVDDICKALNKFVLEDSYGTLDLFSFINVSSSKLNLFFFNCYRIINRLPIFISRPCDYVLRLLNYHNYGYLFRQRNEDV